MNASQPRRAANRPSRKHELVASALDLIALQSHDAISVADIAAHAGMTPAAFYYHFASKDELLEEFVQSFAKLFLAELTRLLREVQETSGLGTLVDRFIDWIEERELEARVYFVGSVGATGAAETARAKTVTKLYREAASTVQRLKPSLEPEGAAAAGVALFTVLQVSARSRLEEDDIYRTLGPMRFRTEIAALAGIAGD